MSFFYSAHDALAT